MNDLTQTLLIVAGSTFSIYIFLSVSMRLMSRRQLGQLTALDLLIIILLGSAVETSMVHGSTSLKAGLVSGTTLFITNYVVTHLMRRSKRFGHICGMGPLLLVHDGKFVEEHLRRTGLTHEDIFHALREREQPSLENVRFAVLEPDGQINVVLMSMAE